MARKKFQGLAVREKLHQQAVVALTRFTLSFSTGEMIGVAAALSGGAELEMILQAMTQEFANPGCEAETRRLLDAMISLAAFVTIAELAHQRPDIEQEIERTSL